MENLKENLLELIRKTSAELPADVMRALESGQQKEMQGSPSQHAMDNIQKNIQLALEKSKPLCHDTGSILFYVEAPRGFDQLVFEQEAKKAVIVATKKGYLRQNSVDSITGQISENNTGPGNPSFHFHQNTRKDFTVRLLLKGGACENVGAQYSLPCEALKADRDLEGVKKCILNAVSQAQGKGCSPGVLGVTIGGDRSTAYAGSKEQFLRPITDVNLNPTLARLEEEIVKEANKLGIGPMGFGGETTLLACKISALNRVPASFFVTISYMCWAFRRQGFVLSMEGEIKKWLY
ncbi:MAG: fumarate hydratase [Deltaproteobacteria bacterium]|nr:fumarate hydratase [Deltaproteobacteria bacterium]